MSLLRCDPSDRNLEWLWFLWRTLPGTSTGLMRLLVFANKIVYVTRWRVANARHSINKGQASRV